MTGKNPCASAILAIVLFLALPALAQGGQASARACPPNTSCKFKNLTATGTLTVTGLINLSGGCVITSGGGLSIGCDTLFGTNRTLAMGSNGIISSPSGWIRFSDGTAALPALAKVSDTDTGIYSEGVNQLSVATNGARSFNFSATPGWLEGMASQPKLKLDTSSGACLDYNSVSGFCVASGSAQLTPGANGLRIVGTNATAFGSSQASVLTAEGNTGRVYVWPTATWSNTPPVDFGGSPHPVLQQKLYWTDTGNQLLTSSGTGPSWGSAAPRSAGTAVTFTEVAAASASAVSAYSAPYGYDFHQMNTLAAAASTSTWTTTPVFVDLNHAPRWAQRTRMNTITSVRVWTGLASALPGASDTPGSSKVGFRFSTAAGDTNWMACYGNAGTTCTSTGVAPTANGAFTLLAVDCREGTACTFWVNGVAVLRQTTSLPATTTGLSMINTVEALSASARDLQFGTASLEMN